MKKYKLDHTTSMYWTDYLSLKDAVYQVPNDVSLIFSAREPVWSILLNTIHLPGLDPGPETTWQG